MATDAAYHRALYRSRVAQHRCVRCAEKLPDEWTKKLCADCGGTQAAWLRANRNTRRRVEHESPRWRELEAKEARCSACGLLEPHVCIQGNAERRESRAVHPATP